MNRRGFLSTTLPAAWACTSLPGLARAADLASTVRVEVGAPPGGGTDFVARSLAMGMTAELKRTLVVENKPGAGGNIAANAVAQAAGDASTLLVAYTSFAINPSIQDNLPYDPVRSFTPISLVATSPLILVCRADLPVKNTAELVDYARKHPKELSIAGAGLGSASQMSGEMFKVQAKLDIVSVPYKGAAPAVQDILGGQVHLLMSEVATVQPLLRSGKLKALGVSTPEPLSDYPNAQPIAQLLPDFNYRVWFGLFAPGGIPADQASALEKAAVASIKNAQIAERLKQQGLDPVGSSRADFTALIQADIKRWQTVASATGVRMG